MNRTLWRSRRVYSTIALQGAVSALEQQLFAEKDAYPKLLQWCGREKCPELAKRVHAHLTRSGFTADVFLSNLLVQMYYRCSCIAEARWVFDSMRLKNAFTWNIMVAAYAQSGHHPEAFTVFEQMWISGVRPIHRPVLALLVRGSTSLQTLRSLHSRIESECAMDPILCTELIRSYGGLGLPDEASRAFQSLRTGKDAICWTALISAYAHNSREREALEIFRRMDSDSAPDPVAFVSALDACSSLGDLTQGTWLHHRVSLEGFKCHILATSLVTFYGRCNRVESARRVFDQHRDLFMDVVSWNAMMAVYSRNGFHTQAIELFDSMNLNPNPNTYSNVLDACANTGALEKGKSIHSRMSRESWSLDPITATALLNMYGRCGLIESAKRIFKSMKGRDPVAWTAMIAAFALNGHCSEALEMFWEMIEGEDLQPDWVTYVGVLSACSHGGLTEEGIKHFRVMCQEYDIQPEMEHFGCMIDLLGRAGQLAEAEEVINSMPFDPSEVTWTAYLNACRMHGDLDRGVAAAEAMFDLDPGNAEPYIALANIYSSVGREEDAKKVRAKLAESRRSSKGGGGSGTSSIEVGNKVHVFSSSTARLHPRYGEIVRELEKLGGVHQGLLNWEGGGGGEQDLEVHVEDHSERLALALGMISSNNPTPLYIVKTERMCWSCHSGFKLVSHHRSVKVRDTRRIHRFDSGMCSCGDYW